MHKTHKILLNLTTILVIIGFICNIIATVQSSSTTYVTPLIVYILILYYSLFAYKTPHGNMLKFVMLFFAISLITRMLKDVALYNLTSLVAVPLAMVFVAYIAGRLDRLEENRFYMIIVLILFLYDSINMCIVTSSYGLTIFEKITIFEPSIAWIALSAAYFSRYLEHKLAGLQDKKYSKQNPLD